MKHGWGGLVILTQTLLFEHLLLWFWIGKIFHELRVLSQLLLSILPELSEDSDLEEVFFYFIVISYAWWFWIEFKVFFI